MYASPSHIQGGGRGHLTRSSPSVTAGTLGLHWASAFLPPPREWPLHLGPRVSEAVMACKEGRRLWDSPGGLLGSDCSQPLHLERPPGLSLL